VSEVGVRQAITQAHHEEWARVVAALTRRFGDLDIAEEAAAEAFATAVARWPADGVPPNPGAWLTTTANRKAIDRIRRTHALETCVVSLRGIRWSDTDEWVITSRNSFGQLGICSWLVPGIE
jgi:predicted RNA polymerase sigma factor